MRACPQCQRTYDDDADFCSRDGTRLVRLMMPSQADLAASLAGRYRIMRKLGEGGMGAVFLAEQLAVGNRPVALKVLLRHLLSDPQFLVRFQTEAGVTGRIRHPNVVTIYESGQADDGTLYIAMEYLEGQSLHEMLESGGALPLAQAAAIVQQAARGLNAAHKLGIVHRDLKPSNIFVTEADGGEWLIKIVDFGIAKLRESSAQTLTGVLLGTPSYMSPEQARGLRSDELDARSDIYSLGIVAYQILTGRVPFEADTPLRCLEMHKREQPPPFRVVSPGLSIPAELERIVRKALAKDRDARYRSALEFATDFASAAAQAQAALGPTRVISVPAKPATEAGADKPTKPPPPAAPPRPAQVNPVSVAPLPPRRAPIKLRRTKTLIPAALALLFAGVIGGLWYYTERRMPAPIEGESPAEKPATQPKIPEGMVFISVNTPIIGRDDARDPEETPAHPDYTVAAFYIDKTPITNAQFAAFVQGTGNPPPPTWPGGRVPVGQSDWPATSVTWEEAQAYCEWKGKRLPSEPEWEYAARGTDGRLYPWGNQFTPLLSNSLEAGLGRLESVGSRPGNASPFGVLDMSGNVWEWCADDYKPYMRRQPSFEIPSDAKVIRGGSFQSDKDHVTTTTRNLDLPTTRSPAIGFRCAKSM